MRKRHWWLATAFVAGSLGTTLAFAGTAFAQEGPAAGVTPGAVTVGSARYVFYTAADGSVWEKNVVTGAEGSARTIGGRLVSAPSAIYDGTNILVFGQGTDDALWYTTCNSTASACGQWISLGGVITSKPGAVAIDMAGDLAVFARGPDSAVWARFFGTADGWGPWSSEGGRLLPGTGPSAAEYGTATEYILVTGTDEGLWLGKISAATGTSGFQPVGGFTTQSPAVTSSSGAITGFATGTDNHGYTENLLTLGGWQTIGGQLTSGLAAITDNSGNAYAYGLGTSGQVYQHAGAPPGAWTEVTP